MSVAVEFLLFMLALYGIVLVMLFWRIGRLLWRHFHPTNRFTLRVAFGDQQTPPRT